MELIYIRISESLAVLLIFFLVRLVIFRIIDKTLKDRFIQESRGISIKKIAQILISSIALILILMIWGVDQSQLGVFIGSLLTVVGVAFFAQWSILSNITSGILLFFNHPVRLHDSIVIMEGKDYLIEGKITDIGLFFISIQTSDSEELTLPNNIFIQKSIKRIAKQE